MAATSNTTWLADLLDPQVVADYIDKKLIDYIRFAPLATIRNDLVGRPGDEVSVPFFKYAGAAEAVAEGQDIPIAKLSQGLKKAKVSKIGKAIQFTDEALLSGYNNDIAEEAAKQVVLAINDKIEKDFLTAMGGATLKSTIEEDENPASGIVDALIKFGEDVDGQKVLLCDPSFYGRLLKTDGWIPNTELGANIIVRGTLGAVYGTQVVLTNRLIGTGKAYIVKPGALALFMKRDTLVEFDRDKLDQTNYIIGSKIFCPYLYDETKIIEVEIESSTSA